MITSCLGACLVSVLTLSTCQEINYSPGSTDPKEII